MNVPPVHSPVSVCIWYDDSFLKRNCKMLMKWFRAVLEIMFVFMYSYIEAENTATSASDTHASVWNRASAPLISTETCRMCRIHILSFCRLIFTDIVHIMFWFKCTDLLLIYSSKMWHIPWHSALQEFHFYDWILRTSPCFPHRGNHRAVYLIF